jgi:hypothetical protein
MFCLKSYLDLNAKETYSLIEFKQIENTRTLKTKTKNKYSIEFNFNKKKTRIIKINKQEK